MKEDYVMICPKCSSVNVHPDLSKDMIVWGGSTRYVCNDCNFDSISFPEVKKSKLKLFKNKIQHRNKDEIKKLNKPAFSKGVTNKNVNTYILLFYVLTITLAIIFLMNGYFTKIIYLTLISLCILGIFFIYISYNSGVKK